MSFDSFQLTDNYGDQVQVKLEEVIQTASPVLTAKVIRKVLENLVIVERVVREKRCEIGDMDRRRLMEREYPDVQAEVDRAVGEFISSIVSREGG